MPHKIEHKSKPRDEKDNPLITANLLVPANFDLVAIDVFHDYCFMRSTSVGQGSILGGGSWGCLTGGYALDVNNAVLRCLKASELEQHYTPAVKGNRGTF
ncbi:MAG: hypothetical protein HY644_15195 [Acidobacteria bacterium]|nr:hypothetical protein [Acidobacteriota bacterium]